MSSVGQCRLDSQLLYFQNNIKIICRGYVTCFKDFPRVKYNQSGTVSSVSVMDMQNCKGNHHGVLVYAYVFIFTKISSSHFVIIVNSRYDIFLRHI